MDADTRGKLKDLLRVHEGRVLHAYDDATGRIIRRNTLVKGYPSIGYGRNLFGRGITETEAELLLSGDITDVCEELDTLLSWWVLLDPVRQIALADMAFNLGPHNLVRDWPNFCFSLKTQDWRNACRELRNTKYHKQVGRRADDLLKMFEFGEMP